MTTFVTVIKENKLKRVERNSFEFFKHLKDNNLIFYSHKLYYNKAKMLIRKEDVSKYQRVFANSFKVVESENFPNNVYVII